MTEDPTKMKDCPRCVAIRAMMQKQIDQQKIIVANQEKALLNMAELVREKSIPPTLEESMHALIKQYAKEGCR